MCINNFLACLNTELLLAYSLIDKRLRPMVYCIKHWIKQRQINNPYRGYLSSYTYTLMTIQFLQTCTPPVLPCLQEVMRADAVRRGDPMLRLIPGPGPKP